MKIVLVGPPGAGKGTQAKKIVEKFDVNHISTGDIFRSNIKNETKLGLAVKDILAKGELVPDKMTIDLVVDKLSSMEFDGFMLDGFPRNIVQAESLDEVLAENNTELDCVINIEVPSEVLIKRLAGRRVCSECGQGYHVEMNPPKLDGICDTCGGKVIQRQDDNEETVKDRIHVYESQTAPLIEYYSKKGKLKSVDGTLSVEEVFEQIAKALS